MYVVVAIYSRISSLRRILYVPKNLIRGGFAGIMIGALRGCIMARGRLEAEVIVLRQQLNMLRRRSPRRVRPNAFDSANLCLPLSVFPRHRQCSHDYLPCNRHSLAPYRLPGVVTLEVSKSRRSTQDRPGIARSGAPENPLWGAPRIHGELLKLG